MVKVSVDFNKQSGRVKPMHAVNNGPTKRGNALVRYKLPTLQVIFGAIAEFPMPEHTIRHFVQAMAESTPSTFRQFFRILTLM